jgi:hypothetical protein
MPKTATYPRPTITSIPSGSWCDVCSRKVFPTYTDDCPDGVPEIFDIFLVTRVVTLCTECLTALEDAAHAALVDRLVTRDGGAA